MVDVCAEGKSPVSWTTGGNCDRTRSQWNRLAVVEPPWAVAAGANQCNVDPGDRRCDSCARRDCPHRPFCRKRRRNDDRGGTVKSRSAAEGRVGKSPKPEGGSPYAWELPSGDQFKR